MIIPFGKPILDESEITAVSKTLKTTILVHGKKTLEFENLFQSFTRSKYGASKVVRSCAA